MRTRRDHSMPFSAVKQERRTLQGNKIPSSETARVSSAPRPITLSLDFVQEAIQLAEREILTLELSPGASARPAISTRLSVISLELRTVPAATILCSGPTPTLD